LGVEEFFNTRPGNIVVVAGTQDAGKTAFMLKLAEMNMSRMPVRYLSSEMGASELKSRLAIFNTPMEAWSVDFRERSSNFADVVTPKGLTIIDFLEMHDTFYEVAKHLTDIHNKLDGGVCVVALQKDPKAGLGRGGTFSLEKPRLYINLDAGYPTATATIVKCKNWMNPLVNPNGLSVGVKIIGGGATISKEGEWQRTAAE
jgi:hypothetical protein